MPFGPLGLLQAMGYTFITLQGFDLIATVAGEVKEPERTLPRAMLLSLGAALGEGRTLAEVMASRTSVAEGVPTSGAVVELARAKGIEMPIAEAVNAIVTEEKTVSRAILDILSRPFTSEHE